MHGSKRAIRHWWVAAAHGVGGSTFGWGVAAAAAILSFAQQQYGYIPAWMQASRWFTPLASAATGLVLVALFNAVVLAPYRAWRMLKPFRIEVVSGQLDGEYPKEAFPRQSAAVTIKNLSYRQRSNCVVHIWQLAGFDNQHHTLPRFLCEFSLLPGDTQQVKFLSWTTRSPPHKNDTTFILNGPVGLGWGDSVITLPCGSYDIDIRIGVPEADAIVIPCRVWADGNRLVATSRDG
jgi:hypothetical protein